MINRSSALLGFAVRVAASLILVLVSSILCVFVSPEASGSGFPEMKSYMNGINLFRFLTFKNYVVKVVALYFAQSAQIVIGA